MEIIKWTETSVKVKPKEKTNIYSKNFFSAIGENGELFKKYNLLIENDGVKVEFNNKIKIFKIQEKEFVNVQTKNNEIEKEFDLLMEKYEVEVPEDFAIIKRNNCLYLQNNTETDKTFNVITKVYMKESYPDFAQNTIEESVTVKAKSEIIVLTGTKAKIVELNIPELGKMEKIDYEPVYYFTNLNALKTFLKDTGFALPTKTDDEYKSKISEKSTFLKRRFGLLPLQLEDYEFYPAFAKLVHLYCLYDFCVYNFISSSNSGVGESGITGASVTLGKFSTKESGTTGSSGGGSSGGSSYIPTLIKEKIKEAEIDLEKSIFNKSVKFKTGGVSYVNRTNIYGCFSNR